MARLAPSILLATALLGCDAEGDSVPVEPPEPRMPTPYLPEIDAPVATAQLDAAAIHAAMQAQVPLLVGLNTAGLVPLLDGLVDWSDADCPGAAVDEDGDVRTLQAENDCTSANGTRFVGAISMTVVGAPEDDAFSFYVEAASLRIETADGRAVTLSGAVGFDTFVGEEGTEISSFANGVFTADAETAQAHPWLNGDEGIAADEYRFLGQGGLYFAVSNRVTFEDGPLSALKVQLAINDWDCEAEPRGSISLREANGVWHDVVYDGFVDEEAGITTATCDGCGAHLIAGVVEAQLCEQGWFEAMLAQVRQ
jgi:hypothetical protein